MRSLLTSLIAVALAFPSTAQSAVVNRKLSGPMVSGVVGDVGELVVSPTGDRVLYQVLRSEEVWSNAGPAELVSAPVDGSAPPVVLSPLDAGSVVSLRWTPDGLRALYVVYEGPFHALYSALADGSAPPTLLFAPPGLHDIRSYPSFLETVQATGDGTRVLYLSGFHLYSIPIDGSAPPVQLNDPLPNFGVVVSFRASPSGSEVIYAADQDIDNLVELYSVPADGSAAPIKISHPMQPGEGIVSGFAIDPSSTRAVYRAWGTGDRHVFSAPLDGSAAAVQLSPSLPAGRVVESFLVSPDGASVVCRANPNAGLRYELFLSPIDGSAAPVNLTPLASVGAVLTPYRFSPDSAYLVFQANTGGATEKLFSVRVSDGHAEVLRTGAVTSFQVAPDSARVVFLFGLRELYGGPIDGSSSPVRINPDLVPGGELDAIAGDDGYAITPDSLGVVYRADADTVGVQELYRVAATPAGTPVATRLNPTLVSGGQVGRFRLTPDSASVVYAADASTDHVTELLRSALAGLPSAEVLSGSLPSAAVGDVTHFEVRAGRAVYRADQDLDEQFELFGAPADGSAPAVELSGTLVSGGDVDPGYTLSPDGSTVVYRASALTPGRLELFSAPSNGSAPPVQLSGSLSPGTNVQQARVSPDGAHVVYVANETTSPWYALRAVPIHGGVSVTLPDVPFDTDFEFTPDSSRVAFVDGPVWVAAIDGTSALIVSSTPVRDFELRDDGARLLYTVSTSTGDHLHVGSIPTYDPVDLSGPMVSGGDVVDFAFSPDGQRAVYLADAFTDGRFLLFSAPVDASAEPIVLNGPLPGGGDVQQFELTSDGASVVYTADQETNGVNRLHRVPLDGSAPDVLLSTFDLGFAEFQLTADGAYALHAAGGLRAQPIVGGDPILIDSGSVLDAVMSEGGRRVFYLSEGRVRVASITGGASLDLNAAQTALTPLALDGERVLYRAEDVSGVEELFASWLARGPVEQESPAETRSVTR